MTRAKTSGPVSATGQGHRHGGAGSSPLGVADGVTAAAPSGAGSGAWPRVWNGGPARPEGAPAVVAEFYAPTKSEANERGAFWRANKRKKDQDAALDLAITVAGPLPEVGPWCVRFTRIATATLDDDNLASAFKRLRDRMSLMLRVNDRSPVVAFAYAQEKRRGVEPSVRVEVWGPDAAPKS